MASNDRSVQLGQRMVDLTNRTSRMPMSQYDFGQSSGTKEPLLTLYTGAIAGAIIGGAAAFLFPVFSVVLIASGLIGGSAIGAYSKEQNQSRFLDAYEQYLNDFEASKGGNAMTVEQAIAQGEVRVAGKHADVVTESRKKSCVLCSAGR